MIIILWNRISRGLQQMFKIASLFLLLFLKSESCRLTSSHNEIRIHIFSKFIDNGLEFFNRWRFCSENMVHGMAPEEKIQWIQVRRIGRPQSICFVRYHTTSTWRSSFDLWISNITTCFKLVQHPAELFLMRKISWFDFKLNSKCPSDQSFRS